MLRCETAGLELAQARRPDRRRQHRRRAAGRCGARARPAGEVVLDRVSVGGDVLGARARSLRGHLRRARHREDRFHGCVRYSRVTSGSVLPRVFRVAREVPVRVVSSDRRDAAWWRLAEECDSRDRPRRRERVRNRGLLHAAARRSGWRRSVRRQAEFTPAGLCERHRPAGAGGSDVRRLLPRTRARPEARPTRTAGCSCSMGRLLLDLDFASTLDALLDEVRRSDARARLRRRQPRPGLPRHARPPPRRPRRARAARPPPRNLRLDSPARYLFRFADRFTARPPCRAGQRSPVTLRCCSLRPGRRRHAPRLGSGPGAGDFGGRRGRGPPSRPSSPDAPQLSRSPSTLARPSRCRSRSPSATRRASRWSRPNPPAPSRPSGSRRAPTTSTV